jgi:hypothetical protein
MYLIHYEDGDREDLEEEDLQEFIDNAIDDQKGLSCKLKLRQATAKRPRINNTTVKSTNKKKARHHGTTTSYSNDKKKKGDPVVNKDSSLWTGVFGESKGPPLQQSIPSLVQANPPTRTQLPKPLWECIPLMLEFYLLLYERQQMFLGRPTKVSVMIKHHFCNNYRELDRGTGYLRSQLIQRHDELLTNKQQQDSVLTRELWLKEVLGMAYIYRLCNKQTTYSSKRNPSGGIPRLGKWNKDHEQYCRDIERERNQNNKNPSFMTRAHQAISHNEYIQYGRDSATSVPRVAQQIYEAGSDLKLVCKILHDLGGISKFRAWQLACDLEEAKCLGPSCQDHYTLLGPGAENGLRDIFGKDALQAYKTMDLVVYLRQNMTYCLQLVGLKFPFWDGRPITLKVIEHALCEFDKFQRVDSTKNNVSNLRTWVSQSHLDERACDACHKEVKTKGTTVRCDTCFFLACHKCQDKAFVSIRSSSKDDPTGRNCCRKCDKIDRLTFSD